MGSPAPPRRGSSHIPDQWTETDQEIIETLLLVDADRPTAHDDAHPVRTAQGSVNHPDVSSANVSDSNRSAIVSVSTHAMDVASAYTPRGQHGFLHPHPYYNQTSPSFQESESQVSDEERRAKHREVQRRFVQRKKLQMERVRSEAADLEKRYGLLRMTMEQHALEKENAQLEGRQPADILYPTLAQVNQILEHECRTAQATFAPINDDEFSQVLRETMEIVAELALNENRKLDDRTRVHVMGWTGRRDIDARSEENASMRFEISKEFARIQPDALVDRAWSAVSSAESYRKFFSPSIPMHVATLQQVNEDAVLMYKAIFNPCTGAVHRSVDLLCRIRRKDEVLILSRGLAIPAVRASVQDPSGWCNSVSVLGFGPPKPSPLSRLREGDGTGCSFRYTSSISGTSLADLRYWMMEIVFVMVRFEALLVAPLFVLAPP